MVIESLNTERIIVPTPSSIYFIRRVDVWLRFPHKGSAPELSNINTSQRLRVSYPLCMLQVAHGATCKFEKKLVMPIPKLVLYIVWMWDVWICDSGICLCWIVNGRASYTLFVPFLVSLACGHQPAKWNNWGRKKERKKETLYKRKKVTHQYNLFVPKIFPFFPRRSYTNLRCRIKRK